MKMLTFRLAGRWNLRAGTGYRLAALATLLVSGAAAVFAEGLSDTVLQQITALRAEKAARTAPQLKMDSQLVYALKLSRNEVIGAGIHLRVPISTDQRGFVTVDVTASVTPALQDFVLQFGGEVQFSSVPFGSMRVTFPLASLEQLAARPEVRFVAGAYRPLLNIGSVTSEGDVTETAGIARTIFGVDGSGVKVGVLSDSVDYLAASQATGDLPGNLVVLAGQSGVPGSGEGTAMLEIVHDLAPGADLYFATANGGPANFAQNILNLRAAGCDIIIDDVWYASEPPFQDGIVARAVNTVTADGALFFSAAGNGGNKVHGSSSTWEGDFVDGGAAGAPVNGRNGNIHLFGTNAYNTATAPGFWATLFWSDPLGASTNDYDLFLLDTNGTTVVASSTTAQTGSQDPFEIIGSPMRGERLVVVKVSGNDRFLHIDTVGGLEQNTGGFVRGHAAAANAFSTAAVNVSTSYPNPFVGGGQNPVEDFSSDGPRRVFFQANGAAITPGDYSATGGALRQCPTVCASDGGVTSVPGFAPFFGTSAAAPHAGAIAALVKSYNSDLSPTQIRNALLSSALDNEAPGVDDTGGYGILMALRALTAAPPPTPLPKLVVVTNMLSGGNGNGTIDYNECNSFDIILTNIGRATGTGIRATLSTTTPGVIIAQPSSTYPNMPVGSGGTNIGTFRISTAPYFVCGTPIDLTLVVKSDQTTSTSQWRIPTGQALPAMRFDSYAAVAIPDNNPVGAYSGLVVSNVDSIISKVTVALYINHTFDSDLTIRLISPGGVTNTLARRRGSSGQNFGFACSPDSQRTVFDDAAATSIAAGAPPFLGPFQPEQPLSVFAGTSGTNVNGTWLLQVVDGAGGDVGSLNCWTLSFASAACVDGGGECPGSDLSIGMVAQPEPVIVGSLLTYTLSVTNAGPSSSKDVTASQVLPSGVIYVSAVASQGGCSYAGGLVTCNLGRINAGGTATATVVVQTAMAGVLTSTANVTSEQPDFNQSNNGAIVLSHVQPPTSDLAIGLSGNPAAVAVGSTVRYTVSVTNNGPSAAFPVIVTNSYPSGILVTGQSVSQGTGVIGPNSTLVFYFGTLTNGGVATASISAIATAEGNALVTATVTPPLVDPIQANNTATLTTVVGPSADLLLRVVDTPDPVVLRGNLTYRITVSNQGPSVATSAALNFTIPVSAVITSNYTSQGVLSVSNNAIVGSFGNIPGQSQVSVVVVVVPTVQGPLVSTAAISAAQPDPNLANNAITTTTQVSQPFVAIVPAGATLTSESFSPPNGSIDPGETVTINLRLRNAGNVNNTNLVATLLPGTGLQPIAPNTPQTYGVLPAGGVPSGRSFSFLASGDPGATITAVLQLKDGPNTLTNVMFDFVFPRTFTFASTNAIEILDATNAAPYPSTIAVSGLTGVVGRVTATLFDVSHGYPQDIDVLLAGPAGQRTVLMSSAGAPPLVDTTFTFDDNAVSAIPDGSEQILATSYRPADYGRAAFALPAPAGPYPAAMASLNGSNPNGTWSLFVADNTPGDTGAIQGGWSISFTTINPVNQLADISVLAVSSQPSPGLVASALTYTFAITNGGPNSASFVTFTNIVPAGANFVSATSSQGSVGLSGDYVIGNLGPLGTGATATVTIVLTPTASAAGYLTNFALASAIETDLNPANNVATIVTPVNLPVADLAVSQTIAPASAVVGFPVTNTIVFTNAGPATALGASLLYPLPAGVTVSSATSTLGTPTVSSGKVTCAFGDLPASGSGKVVVVLVPSATGMMTNNVSLQTISTDPVASNDSLSTVIPVVAPVPVIVAAGTRLTAENGVMNGAIDPGETVTVEFALANTGFADTANLTATLLASGGITPVGSSVQTYGAVLRGGSAVSKAFTFSASQASAGAVTATLRLQDGAKSLGTVAFNFGLPVTRSFENSTMISIPERGAASPYPAVIDISGLDGVVSKVTVTLRGLTHKFPHDLSAVLVNPTGGNVLVLSRVGGGRAVTNATLVFDDSASAVLPNTGQIVDGTYRPSAYEGPVSLRSPAPPAPYGSGLAALNGQSPNGSWLLYVFDDTIGDGGVIARGWALGITTVTPVGPAADLAVSMIGAPSSLLAGGALTYTLNVTNLGPSAASGVSLSDVLPIGVVFGSSTSSQGTVSAASGKVTWAVGNLAAGARASLIINATATLGGTLINQATVSSADTDLNSLNNVAQVSTVVVTPEPARLSGVMMEGYFLLQITAQPGLTYVTQAAADLNSPVWVPISTNTASATGEIKVTDDRAPDFNARFYRAMRVSP